jgi:phosphoglycerate dehydrogenase-like enzyme
MARSGRRSRRARGFGLRILALRRTSWELSTDEVETVASMAELAARSDHLVLALPATRHILAGAVLAHAKPGLHLVNAARGSLIDQNVLIEALDSNRVAAARLDVTDPEPLPEGHPRYSHPPMRLTPHVSWSSSGNAGRLAAKALENLDCYA